MLNQILRFTLVSGLLLWLKPRWRGLLALAAFVVMVHVIHGEYLGYVELSGNQSYLLWSYVLKWLALVIGVLVYFYFAFDAKGRLLNRDARLDKEFIASAGDANVDADKTNDIDDGFNFLRQKKDLENRADKVLHGEKQIGS
jgi:hypothetical protein